MRWLERGAPVFLAAGLAAVVSVALSGARYEPSHPEVLLTVVAVGGFVGIGIGLLLLARPHRRDQRLKQRAALLADRMELWLAEQLRGDPKKVAQQENRRMNQSERQASSALWAQVGSRFGEEFQPQVSEFTAELRQEQVRRYVNFFPSVPGARQAIRELREFASLRGLLPRA